MSRIVQLTGLVSLLFCGSVFAQAEIRWAPDLATARRAAAQFQVPLLVHFYGDKCLPCETLEQRVYSQEAVTKTLNKYFICVRINATKDLETARQFKVHSWPTDVFVSPDGETLYQGVSKQDVNGYMEVLQNVAVMNRDRNTMIAAQSRQPAAPQSVPLQPTAPNQLVAQQSAAASVSPAAYGAQPATNGFSANANANTTISASTPGAQFQVAPPTPPRMMTSNAGLPPMPSHVNAQQLGQNGYAANNSVPNIGPSLNLPVANNGNPTVPVSNTASTQATLVSNPYFAQGGASTEEPMVCTPDGKCGPASQMQQTPVQFVQQQVPAMNPQGVQQPVAQQVASAPLQTGQTAYMPPVSGNAFPPLPAPTTVPVTAPTNLPYAPTFQPRGTTQSTTTVVAEPSVTPPVRTNATLVSTPVESEPKLGLIESVPTEPPAYEGYCPIALVTSGQKVRGTSEHAVRHRGRTYWMQNPEAVKEFMRTPDRYSPILSGYDPMIFLQSGQLVDGVLEYALHDPNSGTVILFSSLETQKQFMLAPDRNSKALTYILNAVNKK